MKKSRRRIVYIAVINDLVSDQRIHRTSATLESEGAAPVLIGRKLRTSLSTQDLPWPSIRFRMLFTRGPLFYLFYNLRLFMFLLLSAKPILILANDLDTLPAASLAARLRRVPLLFDSHEYFTEVPELIGRKRVKRIWERIESYFLPRVKYASTVSGSIARAYKEKYGITFEVIRNLPHKRERVQSQSWKERFPGQKILLYQGAVNKGRGIELMVESMACLENVHLVLAGSGDIEKAVQELIRMRGLQQRITMTGRLKPEELFILTCQADLGLSLEEDLGLNYRFALPNKVFDYVMAGVPVLCSGLPEMAAVVDEYGIGEVLQDRSPEKLAAQIRDMLDKEEKRKVWQEKLHAAAGKLNWETEEEKLKTLFRSILPAEDGRSD